jgi:hypothetical protein
VFCFRLCLFLQTKYKLCFLSSSNGWDNVSTLVANVNSSSDEQMTSARPSLLGVTVAMCVFSPSLLNYYCSDAFVVTSQLPVTIVTYGPVATMPDHSSVFYFGVMGLLPQSLELIHQVFVKCSLLIYWGLVQCFWVSRRYLRFPLISVVNFYYIINKLIILVPITH